MTVPFKYRLHRKTVEVYPHTRTFWAVQFSCDGQNWFELDEITTVPLTALPQ